MNLEGLEHLRFVVRLLRIAHETDPVQPDQAEVVDLALAAFFKAHKLDEATALPLIESLAFPDRDR